jgi:beta-propeller repeat-containing protein
LLLLKATGVDLVSSRDRGSDVRLEFEGTQSKNAIEGVDRLQSESHYLTGNDPSMWHTGVATYAAVRYRNVYPGIDVVFYGNDRRLEYDFVVRPGADPSVIDLSIDSEDIRLSESGDLIATAGHDATVKLHAPEVYQDSAGVRKPIRSRFVVQGQHVRLWVDEFDRRQPLIIDPVIDFSTFLGRSGSESAKGMAIDAVGNIYVVGSSEEFADVFIMKLSNDGQTILFSTTIGGANDDVGNAIAVDTAGNIYVTGQTTSSDFPVVNAVEAAPVSGPNQAAVSMGFILKIDSTGSRILYSTYFNGIGTAIAVDAAGNAYITGSWSSVQGYLPVPNTLFPPGEFSDAFAAKLGATGNVIYATYLGGSRYDAGNAIATDSAGNAYVAGYTNSTDFPVTVGAFEGQWNVPYPCLDTGGRLICLDGFLTKINPTGTALTFSTYLGAAGESNVASVAVDAAFNIYLAGSIGTKINSGGAIGPLEGSNGGFVAKFKPDGSGPVYFTQTVGGPTSLALDAAGGVIIGGGAPITGLPLVNAVQPGWASNFIARLAPDGSSFTYSSYVGSDLSQLTGVAAGSDGSIYAVGTIQYQRPDFFTYRALRPFLLGVHDAFLVKISPSGSETIFQTMPQGSTTWTSSSGATSPNIGFAELSPSSGTSPATGVAIFDSRVNGVLVNEAGVPASAPIKTGRIDVQVGGGVTTGIAMANPTNAQVVISFNFTDALGNDFSQGQWTIPAHGQIANYLDSMLANTTRDPRTFTFTANVPVAVMALRGYVNERSEFLTSTLPVADPSSIITASTRIPQFADGGGWTTQIILINPAESPLSGTIVFFGHGDTNSPAAPVSIPVSGTAAALDYAYNIPPHSSVRFQTLGQSAATQTGSVQIMPSGGSITPVGEALFSFKDHGTTVSLAGVPSEKPSTGFRIYADVSGVWGQPSSTQTGIAITNGSATQPINVQLVLYSSVGAVQENATIVLPANGQRALFLREIPNWNQVRPGVLRIYTEAATGITVIGLRGRYNERGDFLMATLPALDETLPPPTGPIIFPHIVTGGGYTTQLAIFSANPTQMSFGQVLGFNQTGAPMQMNGQ